MDTVRQDLRYALRTLMRTPRLTLIVILTLALGVGASSGIFSLVNAVLLRRLPFTEPNRLMMVWLRNLPQGVKQNYLSGPDFSDFRDQNRVFQDMAAFRRDNFDLTGAGETGQVLGWYVSANFFSMLGTLALRGRTFLPDEDQPGHDRVALISAGLWRRRFGSDPGIVGKSVDLSGASFTVVGIMPPGFNFPPDVDLAGGALLRQPDIWIPLDLKLRTLRGMDLNQRGWFALPVLARLLPGATLAQAQSDLETIDHRLQSEYPVTNRGWDVCVLPLEEQLVGNIRPALLLLFGAVGFVLLIACGNAASLLLTKSAGRQKEIAIRAALGARRRRLARQVLTESIVLGAASGVLAVAVAYGSIPLFLALAPQTMPRAHEARVDVVALAFTTGLGLFTGLLMGLAPAWHASRPDLSGALTETGRTATGGPRGQRLRGLLMTFEIALALVLLAGAGLMVKSFLHLESVDLGFDRRQLVTLRLTFDPARYPEERQRTALFKELLLRVRGLPGVLSAGGIDSLPLSGLVGNWTFDIEGRPPLSPDKRPIADIHRVTPGFFRTMGIPLLAGRDFGDQDEGETPKVAIINETLAQRFFPAENPLGKRINLVDPPAAPEWRLILGVVGDARYDSVNAPPGPDIYLPYREVVAISPNNQLALVIRSAIDAGSMGRAVQREVGALDRQERVFDVKTMDERLWETLAKQRLYLVLLGLFSLVALVLAALGLYGVVSYNTAQRTREVGIRMALGAAPGDVVKLVVVEGMKMTALGMTLGLAGMLFLRHVMASLLFEVAGFDLTVLTAAPLLLAGVALGACYFPARKATRVDPIVALHVE